MLPGYILVGVALGPFVEGAAADACLRVELAVEGSAAAENFLDPGAELGIGFLLFFLGLAFKLDELFAHRNRVGAAGQSTWP